MPAMQDLIRKKRSRILAIAGQHGARNLRVFGSVARGEAGPESDLDLLVELEPGRSLLDHIALIQDLEEALGCRVDVVTEAALKERYKKRILKEAVPIRDGTDRLLDIPEPGEEVVALLSLLGAG